MEPKDEEAKKKLIETLEGLIEAIKNGYRIEEFEINHTPTIIKDVLPDLQFPRYGITAEEVTFSVHLKKEYKPPVFP